MANNSIPPNSHVDVQEINDDLRGWKEFAKIQQQEIVRYRKLAKDLDEEKAKSQSQFLIANAEHKAVQLDFEDAYTEFGMAIFEAEQNLNRYTRLISSIENHSTQLAAEYEIFRDILTSLLVQADNIRVAMDGAINSINSSSGVIKDSISKLELNRLTDIEQAYRDQYSKSAEHKKINESPRSSVSPKMPIEHSPPMESGPALNVPLTKSNDALNTIKLQIEAIQAKIKSINEVKFNEFNAKPLAEFLSKARAQVDINLKEVGLQANADRVRPLNSYSTEMKKLEKAVTENILKSKKHLSLARNALGALISQYSAGGFEKKRSEFIKAGEDHQRKSNWALGAILAIVTILIIAVIVSYFLTSKEALQKNSDIVLFIAVRVTVAISVAWLIGLLSRIRYSNQRQATLYNDRALGLGILQQLTAKDINTQKTDLLFDKIIAGYLEFQKNGFEQDDGKGDFANIINNIKLLASTVESVGPLVATLKNVAQFGNIKTNMQIENSKSSSSEQATNGTK